MKLGKDLVILGNGCHAEVIVDCCDLLNIKIKGFLSENHSSIFDIPTIGNDDLLNNEFFIKNHKFFVAVGDNQNRYNLFKKIEHRKCEIISIIHPTAIISKNVKIAKGVFIAAGTVIQTGVKIAANCIINTATVIEHHCFIGHSSHLAPGVVLAGNVKVGMSEKLLLCSIGQ